LDPGIFSGIPKLEILKLNNNELDRDQFKNLSALKDRGQNGINIAEYERSLFKKNTSNTKVLNLFFSNLTRFEQDILCRLPNLKDLDI